MISFWISSNSRRVPLILAHIYRDSSRSPLLVDVIIHKETIDALSAADDNIRSEHWDELAAALALAK